MASAAAFFKISGAAKVGITLRKVDRFVLHRQTGHLSNDGFRKLSGLCEIGLLNIGPWIGCTHAAFVIVAQDADQFFVEVIAAAQNFSRHSWLYASRPCSISF